jgi:hypothetical protein
MQRMAGWLVAAVLVAGVSGSLWAGESGNHYPNGVEGIKGGSIPPPGTYLRLYSFYYTADTLNDADGNESPVDFNVDVWGVAPRLIWITNQKLWGADYGMDILVPFISTDLEVKAAKLDGKEFGMGDIYAEPFLLSWHGKCYDLGFGLAAWIPLGEYDVAEPASPGKDYWTGMATLGGTYYPDSQKTWSVSVLSRYETHSEKDETDVTLGDDFHFEWGVAKTLAKTWDVGAAGYCQWQVTDDSGSDVIWDKGVHDRVFAAGPEIVKFIPSAKLFASLRGLFEFDAKDRSEGDMAVLTLTKIF